MEIQRLFEIPEYQLKTYPKSDSLCAKVDGTWVKTSTQEFLDTSMKVSKSLVALGVNPNDKVALIADNTYTLNTAAMTNVAA